MNIQLGACTSESEVEGFWKLFDHYINELALNVSLGDEFDLEYFRSDEYRDAIESLRTRSTNPLRIFFICKEDFIIGFFMYVTYFDEDGKCLLMEFYIETHHRNVGNGKLVYSLAEKHIKDEGALFIELTPTNEANERFWCSVGYKKSKEMDEDNKYYYRRYLTYT